MKHEINAIILAIITTAIGLFSLYFPDYGNRIIISTLITFVAYILFIYVTIIYDNKNEIKELKKSFKRAEDLALLRLEIEDLKRKIK